MFASSGNEIKIWNTDTNELIKEYPAVTSKLVNKISFNIKPDNSQIACVVDQCRIDLFELETNYQRLVTESTDSKCCSYDTAGRNLAVGNTNGFMDLYDCRSQYSLKKKSWRLGSASINCICWSKNDRYIAAGDVNGSISVFNYALSSCAKPLIRPPTSGTSTMVTSLQYTPKTASNLAAAYDDGTVILWDTTKESTFGVFKNHTGPSTAIAISPLNTMLMVSAGLDKQIVIYDITARRALNTVLCSHSITSLDLHANGSNLCVGTVVGEIFIFDLRSKLDEPLSSFQAHDSIVHCVKYFNNNSTSLANGKSITTSIGSNLDNNQYMSLQPTSANIMQEPITKSNSLTFDGSNNLNTVSSNYSLGNQQQISTHQFKIYSPEILSQHSKLPTYKLNSHTSNTNLNALINASINNDTQLLPVNSTSISNGQLKKQGYNQASGNPILTINDNISNITSPTSNCVPVANGNGMLHVDKNDKRSAVTKNRGEIYSPLSSTANSAAINTYTNGFFKNENSRDEPMEINSPFVNTMSTIRNATNLTELNTPKQQQSTVNLNSDIKKLNGTNHINGAMSNSNLSPVLVNDDAQNGQENVLPNQTEVEGKQKISNNFLPLDLIREIIKDQIEDLKDEIMSENFKFKSELIKEFMALKQHISCTVRESSINDALVDEIVRLREENQRLKKLF